MQRYSTATTILGSLAMIAMFALSSPGVRAVRAADDATGKVCEAGTVEGGEEVAGQLRQVEPRAQPQPEGARSDDETIVLNNRGFNRPRTQMPFPTDPARPKR
jgi:hypothetical protein